MFRVFTHSYPIQLNTYWLLPIRCCLLLLPPGRHCSQFCTIRLSMSWRATWPQRGSVKTSDLHLAEGGSPHCSLGWEGKCHSRTLKHFSISSLFNLLMQFIFPMVHPFGLIIPFLGIHPKELSSNNENSICSDICFTFFLLSFIYSGRGWQSKAVRSSLSHSFVNIT